MCHALFTTEGATQGDGRTAAGLNLGAIPVGPAVGFRGAFRVRGRSESLAAPVRFGLGCAINSQGELGWPNPRTFSWAGWGGSAMFVDLDARSSYAYVINKMVNTLTGDPRSTALAAALYSAL